MNIQTGSIINKRYEVIAPLGEGGFAQVFKASDLKLGRTVAIKILRSLQLESDEDLKRFQREAQILAKMLHKNIVSIYAFDLLDNTQPFLVMEYAEGAALSRIIAEKGKLRLEQAQGIFLQICQALAYAHQSGVVHRDLSPHNILLCGSESDLTVKLIDFGLSRIVADVTGRLTTTGLLVGNPQYMSPEQTRGDNVDERADIYSLGCIMYECLSGKAAFVADSPVRYLHLQQKEYPPEPVLASSSKEAERLKYIVLRCLQKERSLRFQNCQELVEAVLSDKTAAELHDSTRDNSNLHSWSGKRGPVPGLPANVLPVRVIWIFCTALTLFGVFSYMIFAGKLSSTGWQTAQNSSPPDRKQLIEWLKESGSMENQKDFRGAQLKRQAVTKALELLDRSPWALASLYLETADDYRRQGKQAEATIWAKRALNCLQKVQEPDYCKDKLNPNVEYFNLVDRAAELCSSASFSRSESHEMLQWFDSFSKHFPIGHLPWCELVVKVARESREPINSELIDAMELRDRSLAMAGDLARLKEAERETEKTIAQATGYKSVSAARYLLHLGTGSHYTIPHASWNDFIRPLATRAKKMMSANQADFGCRDWQLLSRLFLETEDYQEAQSALKHAENMVGDDWDQHEHHWLLGDLRLHQRRYAEAAESFRHSLEFWCLEGKDISYDIYLLTARQLALSLVLSNQHRQAADEMLAAAKFLEGKLPVSGSALPMRSRNESMVGCLRLLSAKLYLLAQNRSKALACLQDVSGELRDMETLSNNLSCAQMASLVDQLKTRENLNQRLEKQIFPDTATIRPYLAGQSGYATTLDFYGHLLFECGQVEESARQRILAAERIEKTLALHPRWQKHNADLCVWLRGNAAICLAACRKPDEAKSCLETAAKLGKTYRLNEQRLKWLKQIADCPGSEGLMRAGDLQ